MNVNPNNIKVKEGTGIYRGEKPLADIFIDDNLKVKVFQGSVGEHPENDIIVRYPYVTSTGRSTLRQPKHIHWVIDLLMKRQGNKELTINFLENIVSLYEESAALPDNNYRTLGDIIDNGTKKIDLDKYTKLNDYGVYDIKFLCVILILFIEEEKTSFSKAFMFKNVINELVKDKIDIYNIVSSSQPYRR